jgi:hypothetical protein
MKNKIKIFVFCISLIIILTAFFPIINSKSNTFNKLNLNNFIDIKKNKPADIILFQYLEDGSIEKNVKEVSIKDALHFTKDLQNFNSGSLIGKFNTINGITYKEKINNQNRLLFNNLKILDKYDTNILTKIYYNKLLNQRYSDRSMTNFICKLKFKLLGFGFVLGTHGIVPVGGDILGIFVGIGSVDATDGFLDDQHKSGFNIGGFIGFVGSLVLVIIPFFPGPFISADGIAGASFWI